MLTPAQEDIIQMTAPVVAEHLNAIAQRLYPLMFERYPQVKPLFNSTHQKNGGQPRALAGMILAYVQLRQSPQKARETLEIVVNKHVALDIQPDQYPIVGECLMAAIGEVLGDAVTPEIADAWSGLYQELADVLIDMEKQRYNTFEQQPGGWRGTRRFRIAQTKQESSVIRSFILEPEDGKEVAVHLPGQYIGVKLFINGESVYRHYSLSDVPNGRSYRLSIKREDHGVASRHFHDQLSIGDTIELLPPAGELILAGDNEPLLLISGGVGQTPLLPIAKQALKLGRNVTYLHAALDIEHHAFGDALAVLRTSYPEQLNTVTIYENQAGGDHQGRIDDALLANYLTPEARCYFVGPHAFMVLVNRELERLGVPASMRHFEHFGPAEALNTV
ncbi:nitric oxide dioxygenase [Halomonas sp. FME1]|uniref:nitric oxide dioxygenase n=1 Tax=Halomonas casei TaxID=2742613 RepID=A0ABR9F1R8_9GAMM|nr:MULTISPECIES: globin domain-containing protein [Halomonas]MBE0400407.1 nitric oxide dioxygenase [Halomonas casei]PCC22639.1 nitric oxide dioxygenase [Halomonas sp. JB37]